MEINANKWSLSLDLDGGRIRYLKFDNIPVLGTYKRIDGKIGNTHICAPSFDKEGQEKFDLPFHGYARTLMWDCEQISDTTIQIKAVTPVTEDYPAKLELIQRFALEETFKHTVEVTSLDGSGIPVNIGIHYYWDTPKGWEGTTLNSKQIAPYIKKNEYLDLNSESIVVFPHAKYIVKADGFHSVMAWTSFIADEIGSKTYNYDFCCIEPIIGWPGYFGKPESFIKPHESVSVSVELQKVV